MTIADIATESYAATTVRMAWSAPNPADGLEHLSTAYAIHQLTPMSQQQQTEFLRAFRYVMTGEVR